MGPVYTNTKEQPEELNTEAGALQVNFLFLNVELKKTFTKERAAMDYNVSYTVDYYENYTDDDSTSFYDQEPCNLRWNHEHEVVIQTYIYSLICVLGLVGNILVLVTYALYKKAKTMTDIYLVNVALADLLFVVALPLIIYNERHDWYMGTWACKMLSGSYSINLYSSTLLLACISGDRYVAIVQARRSVRIRTRVHVYSRLICSVTWLLAIFLSVPTFVYYERVEDTDGNECIPLYQLQDTAKVMKVLIPGTQMVVGFLVPLLVMMFCYSCIIGSLLRARNFRKHKAVRVVLVVVMVFVLCHLPYNVALLIHTMKLFKSRTCKDEQMILMTMSVSRNVAYLHCCLNPILYAFIGVKFRSHFCQILQDVRCLGKRYIYSGRSSQQTSDLYLSANKTVVEGSLENPSSFTM